MNKAPEKNTDNNISRWKKIKMKKKDSHRFLFDMIGRLFERP